MPKPVRSNVYTYQIGNPKSINRSYNFVNKRDGGLGPAYFWNNFIMHDSSTPTPPTPPTPATEKVMILTCIDYRLMEEVVIAMNKLGYSNMYDQFILAGSSLGFNYGTVDETKVPLEFNYWQQSFYDNIDIAIQLHHIKQIFLIDHCDCGAYEAFYNVEFDDCADPTSLERHYSNLSTAASTLTEKYKNTYGEGDGLTVKKFIIQLNGVMVEIP